MEEKHKNTSGVLEKRGQIDRSFRSVFLKKSDWSFSASYAMIRISGKYDTPDFADHSALAISSIMKYRPLESTRNNDTF